MKLPPVKKIETKQVQAIRDFTRKEKWLIYLSIILFFGGSFLSAFFGFRTIIGIFEFLRLLAAMIAVAAALMLITRPSAFPMKRYERLALAIFGLGPFFCGLYLFINFRVPTEKVYSDHLVKRAYTRGGSVYFLADGLPCKEYPELCAQFMAGRAKFTSGDSVRVRIDKGIGGYRVMKDVRLKAKAP